MHPLIDKIGPIARLCRQLQSIPYLASKQLYRVVDHFLGLDVATITQLSESLQEIKEKIIACAICGMWQEKLGSCPICSAHNRTKTIICVVETWQELLALDRSGGYNGMFHILGGAISPLEGKNPEDLRIEQLMKRLHNEPIVELILATNQTPEGEATATFIAKKAHAFNTIKISTLARGMPIGGSLEYTDKLTLLRALTDRRPF